MPATDDTRLTDLLHTVAPEPPDELLDLTALRARVRHRRTVRVASLAASAVTVTAGLTTSLVLNVNDTNPATGVTSTPPSTPPPTRPAPVANDVLPGTDCRAHVIDGRLVAPFDLLSGDRFDPPNRTSQAHTIEQVLAAYRSKNARRPAGRPQVFVATHSMAGLRATRQVWVVVTYHVIGPPAMGPSPGPATTTDEVAGFDAATLHPLWVIYTMPMTCDSERK